MRRTSRTGSFFLILLFNIMLNFRLTIPGWILLILHFIIPQYIKWWYCLVYFGVFLLYMLVWMLILWGLVLWMIFTFRKVDPTAAKLQIPYFLWLTFAAYLNLGVCYLNR